MLARRRHAETKESRHSVLSNELEQFDMLLSEKTKWDAEPVVSPPRDDNDDADSSLEFLAATILAAKSVSTTSVVQKSRNSSATCCSSSATAAAAAAALLSSSQRGRKHTRARKPKTTAPGARSRSHDSITTPSRKPVATRRPRSRNRRRRSVENKIDTDGSEPQQPKSYRREIGTQRKKETIAPTSSETKAVDPNKPPLSSSRAGSARRSSSAGRTRRRRSSKTPVVSDRKKKNQTATDQKTAPQQQHRQKPTGPSVSSSTTSSNRAGINPRKKTSSSTRLLMLTRLSSTSRSDSCRNLLRKMNSDRPSLTSWQTGRNLEVLEFGPSSDELSRSTSSDTTAATATTTSCSTQRNPAEECFAIPRRGDPSRDGHQHRRGPAPAILRRGRSTPNRSVSKPPATGTTESSSVCILPLGTETAAQATTTNNDPVRPKKISVSNRILLPKGFRRENKGAIGKQTAAAGNGGGATAFDGGDTNKLDTATKDLRNYRTMLSLNNGDRGPRKESPAAKFRSSFRKKNQKKVASRYELMASVGSFCDDVREDEETTASRSAPELSKGDANDNSVNASEPAGDVLQDLTMQDVSSPGLPMMPIPSSPSDKMITNEGAVSTSADTEVPNNTLVLEECEEMMSMASFSYDATRELSNNRPGERSCKTGTCANGEKTITKGRINPPVDDSNANDATDENNQRNGPAIVVEESDEMMSMIEFSKDDTDGLSTFYVEGPIKVHKGKQLRGRSGCATTLAPKSSDTDCLYSNSKAPSEDTAAAIAAGEAEDNEDENTSTRCHDCLQIDFSRISDSGKGNIFVQTMPKTCTNSKSEGSIGKTEMR